MQSCIHPIESRYLHRIVLGTPISERLRTHLRRCPYCQSRLFLIRSIREDHLRTNSVITPKDDNATIGTLIHMDDFRKKK